MAGTCNGRTNEDPASSLSVLPPSNDPPNVSMKKPESSPRIDDGKPKYPTATLSRPKYVYVKGKDGTWVPEIRWAEAEQAKIPHSEMTAGNKPISPVASKGGEAIPITKQKKYSTRDNTKNNNPKEKSDETPETLLQCVDNDGHLVTVDDLRDLPYLHEASILYNLKDRYERQTKIYTRAHNRVLIAVNPHEWIEGMYAEDKRIQYAEYFVWNKNNRNPFGYIQNLKNASLSLEPHLYEVSSLAMRGLQLDNIDQTIVVSGESGSGKTTASKIIMSHLATFHELKKAYVAQMPQEEEITSHKVEKVKQQGIRNFVDAMRKAMDRLAAIFRIRPLIPPGVNLEANDNGGNNQHLKDKVIPNEMQEEPEEMRQTNLIVQRVLDANPLIEAFGNAKTPWNDNSSRFSKHTKLQFHVQPDTLKTNIVGSVSDTFLLEKSRVVGQCHQNATDPTKERTFHIFYQLMEASEDDKLKIWDGLLGKDASSFRYIGQNAVPDLYTNQNAFKNTISALELIGIVDDNLRAMLRSLCVVVQLGNIVFEIDPKDADASIVHNASEVDALSPLLGVESSVITKALTHKTISAVHDTYEVPLNAKAAKATCDAFAKEIYCVLFDWLVQQTNDATCATKNYMFASEEIKYRHIAALDLFGFEAHDENGFEQLLINHANERLQKNFTDTFIESILEEYDEEGISIQKAHYERNDAILNFLEGKGGFIALLNEECIRPQGCDEGFTNKIYSNLKSCTTGSNSPLVKRKHYDLSPTNTMFGIQHFAGLVDYDATGFVDKNRDTLADDILIMSGQSSNSIVSLLSKSYNKVGRRKGSLIGTSLWTKFGQQMKTLFSQIEQTRTAYVRCIIPNMEKKPRMIDLTCTMDQLRSVGILTAIRISHTFPEKKNHAYVLEHFWPVMYKREGYESFRKKYTAHSQTTKRNSKRISDETNANDMARDCETLLAASINDDDETDDIKKMFEVGKTRIYFRSGGMNLLEKELAITYNTCATVIQSSVRRYLVRCQMQDYLYQGRLYKNGAMRRLMKAILSLPRSICVLFLRLCHPPPPMISQKSRT